jgi:hypothetical protein
MDGRSGSLGGVSSPATGTERSQARLGQVAETFAREIMGAPPCIAVAINAADGWGKIVSRSGASDRRDGRLFGGSCRNASLDPGDSQHFQIFYYSEQLSIPWS